VVTILALAAAVLYGTADFLGGVASRRASVFAVLALTVPAGAVVMLVVALLGQVPALGGHGGLGSAASVGDWSAVGWAAASGVCGAAGLVAFYAGFATAPISVVAPVAALVSAVLPVGVAIAGGERPAATVIVGGLICLVAIVLVSAQPADHDGARPHDGPRDHGRGRRLVASRRLRALGYGAAAGAGFGLFFIFLKNAGQSGAASFDKRTGPNCMTGMPPGSPKTGAPPVWVAARPRPSSSAPLSDSEPPWTHASAR